MSETTKRLSLWGAIDVDPSAKAGTDWCELANVISFLHRDGKPSQPLSIPIDPAAVASQNNPRGSWGLREAMRGNLALQLLGALESGDHQFFESLSACMKYRSLSEKSPTIETIYIEFVFSYWAKHEGWPTKGHARDRAARIAQKLNLFAPPCDDSTRWRRIERKTGLSWLQSGQGGRPKKG